MRYLAGQIILFLILAILIGFVVGWLFRHFWGSRAQRTALADTNRELETCRSLLRTAQDRTSTVERDAGAASGRVAELEAALEAAASDGNAIRLELETRIADLEGDLDTARSRSGDLEARTGEIDALRSGLADRDARIADLEAGVDDQIHELGAALDAKDARITELEARLAADQAPQITQDEAAAQVAMRFAIGDEEMSDDLKAIRGIGPKLEGLLNSMGIRTFRQIAQWGPDDIAMVTAALDAFPGRIARDDWIGAATKLLRDTYGEEL